MSNQSTIPRVAALWPLALLVSAGCASANHEQRDATVESDRTLADRRVDAALPDGSGAPVRAETTEGTLNEVGQADLFATLDPGAPAWPRGILGFNVLLPRICLDGTVSPCHLTAAPQQALATAAGRRDVSEANLLALLHPTVLRLASGSITNCMRWHDDDLPLFASSCAEVGSACDSCNDYQVCTANGCAFRGVCQPPCDAGQACVLDNCDFECDLPIRGQMLSPTAPCVRWNHRSLRVFAEFAESLLDPVQPGRTIVTLNLRQAYTSPEEQATLVRYANTLGASNGWPPIWELGNELELWPDHLTPAAWRALASQYVAAIQALGLETPQRFSGPVTTYQPGTPCAAADTRPVGKAAFAAALLEDGHFDYDYYDFHHYPCLLRPTDLLTPTALTSLRQDLDAVRGTGYTGPVAITEFGPSGSASDAWGTWAEALWTGAFLAESAQGGVDIVTKWSAQGWSGVALVQRQWNRNAPPAEKGRLFVNPVYYLYLLAAQTLGPLAAEVQASNNEGLTGPRLWVLASQDGSTVVSYVIVNPTSRAVPVGLHTRSVQTGHLCAERVETLAVQAPSLDATRNVTIGGTDLNRVIFERLNSGSSPDNYVSAGDILQALDFQEGPPLGDCDPVVSVPPHTLMGIRLHVRPDPRARDALPPKPAAVSSERSTDGIHFHWSWTGDRAQTGASPVGYCTNEGTASSDPSVPCDPQVNAPFWWRIVLDPDSANPQVIFHWFSGQDTNLPRMGPGATGIVVSCAGLEGHALRLEVVTRDALGNMAPDEVQVVDAECPLLDLPDDVAPDPPEVSVTYDGTEASLRFRWQWTQDRGPEGGRAVGMCTPQGLASGDPTKTCDPELVGPYWWQIVDVSDPENPVLLLYYYNAQNTNVADASPHTTTYAVSCGDQGTQGSFRADVMARDAAGNKSQPATVTGTCPADTLPPRPARIVDNESGIDGTGQPYVSFDWAWVGDRAPEGVTPVGFCTSQDVAYGDPSVSCDQDTAGPFVWEVTDSTTGALIFFYRDAGHRHTPTGIGPGSHAVTVPCDGRTGHGVSLRVWTRDALGNLDPSEPATAHNTCP